MIILTISVFLGFLMIFMINKNVNNSKVHIMKMSELPKTQTAIVLGAYVSPSGELCDMLKDRVKTGVELYKSGKVKKLLMTGDHGKFIYDEVNNMCEYAEKLGVPPQDIFLDHAGFSTYESMYRAKKIFKVESAVIVTQEFHLPRAIYLARRLGIEATGVIADKYIYANSEFYNYREMLAICKDFIKVNILHSKSTYLGETIHINGDGRKTHDLDKI